MMIEGKLRWHYNRSNGSWYTHSHSDDAVIKYIYAAEKLEPGCWEVRVVDRSNPLVVGMEPLSQVLGHRGTLLQAKRLADEHHHAYLREHGTPADKRHILRFPVA